MFLLLISLLLLAALAHASGVKDADLAVSRYPGSREDLSALIRGYLDGVPLQKVDGTILAVIAPHAGYAYSDPVAAYAYKAAIKQAAVSEPRKSK